MKGMHYAEGLITPHPRKTIGDPPQELVALVAPQQFADELGSIENPLERESITLAAASFIASQVAEALWYPEKNPSHNDFTAFDIEEPVQLSDLKTRQHASNYCARQIADCFGFTAVTSELMEAADIEHWVGFANGHATILLPSVEKGAVHLNDPLSPNLSQTLRSALLDGRYAIQRRMETADQSAVMLSSLIIARNAVSTEDAREFLQEHPWLVYNRNGVYAWGQSSLPTVPERLGSRLKIIMRTFQPVLGRKSLQFYQDFKKAVDQTDYLKAAGMMDEVGYLFPDTDARNSHAEIKAITRDLGSRGYIEFGQHVLDAYFTPLNRISEDSRFIEAHGDCLRILATYGEDWTSAELAVAKYRQALTNPKSYQGAIKGKLARVEDILPG